MGLELLGLFGYALSPTNGFWFEGVWEWGSIKSDLSIAFGTAFIGPPLKEFSLLFP